MLINIFRKLFGRLFLVSTLNMPVGYKLVANTRITVDNFIQEMVIDNNYKVVCSNEKEPKMYMYYDENNEVKGVLIKTSLHDFGYKPIYR